MFIAMPPIGDPFRSAVDAQDEQAARIREATVLGRSRATATAINATNKIKITFTTLVPLGVAPDSRSGEASLESRP
jgi:hypothetical protein